MNDKIFAEQFPSFILSPIGGVISDRYQRNKSLQITQAASAVQAVLLTLASFFGYGTVWVLLTLSFFMGVANAFDVPVRQAMVNDLIAKPEDLSRAIAMNSSINNLSRLLGPALAGMVLAHYSEVFCFAVNAVGFILVVICLQMMKVPPHQPTSRTSNIWRDFVYGCVYVSREYELRNVIILSTLLSTPVMTYNTLQPYYAEEVLEGGALAYGYINSATGLGALISALYISFRPSGTNLKKLLFNNLLFLSAALFILSFVTVLPLYLFVSMLCGFCVMSIMPVCNTVLQMTAYPRMRGRVISLFIMSSLGAIPIGSVFEGFVAGYLPTEICMAAQSIICFVITLAFKPFLHKNYLPRT
ncbi:MAG: MFS transporter [Bacteroidetes bacterium]|uniref:MFS transporter n=1 Tax=Candidatus Caccoplasma merdipullorum TaxID=2840718 RepID=A0A9D9E6F3_9BACT|nr:MFS transporter [Candidatus Caccoplasma merdipullorum]